MEERNEAPQSPPSHRESPQSPPSCSQSSPSCSQSPPSCSQSPPPKGLSSYECAEAVMPCTLDEQALKNIKSEQEKFHYICQQFFSMEEIKNSSRTGKRTVKCGENPRPGLNPVTFGKLQEAVIKYCNFDRVTFIKKFENYQKVLRKTN